MKKSLLAGIFIASIASLTFYQSKTTFDANALLLGNIEALASDAQEEKPTEITSCAKDGDVTSDPNQETSFTICNSQTTTTQIYTCGDYKKGYKNTYSDYKCKVKK